MPLSVSELNRYRLIVDTGPLLDFLLHRCIKEYDWDTAARHLSVLRNASDAEIFRERLLNQTEVVVSDGVLVEIENHRRRWKLATDKFWRVAREELLAIRIDEARIQLRELREDDLYRFGLVDASLMYIASIGAMKPGAIVTADIGLYHGCRARLIKSFWISEILSVEP